MFLFPQNNLARKGLISSFQPGDGSLLEEGVAPEAPIEEGEFVAEAAAAPPKERKKREKKTERVSEVLIGLFYFPLVVGFWNNLTMWLSLIYSN